MSGAVAGGRRTLLTVMCATLLAAAMTLGAALGILEQPDLAVCDALYQSQSAFDGEIVLIGIDQRALDEIGPYSQRGRDVIATVLDTLNQSEDCHPAVIALDVIYTGNSDPELDDWLAEAAGRYGNVVTACAAQFQTTLEGDEGDGGL